MDFVERIAEPAVSQKLIPPQDRHHQDRHHQDRHHDSLPAEMNLDEVRRLLYAPQIQEWQRGVTALADKIRNAGVDGQQARTLWSELLLSEFPEIQQRGYYGLALLPQDPAELLAFVLDRFEEVSDETADPVMLEHLVAACHWLGSQELQSLFEDVWNGDYCLAVNLATLPLLGRLDESLVTPICLELSAHPQAQVRAYLALQMLERSDLESIPHNSGFWMVLEALASDRIDEVRAAVTCGLANFRAANPDRFASRWNERLERVLAGQADLRLASVLRWSASLHDSKSEVDVHLELVSKLASSPVETLEHLAPWLKVQGAQRRLASVSAFCGGVESAHTAAALAALANSERSLSERYLGCIGHLRSALTKIADRTSDSFTLLDEFKRMTVVCLALAEAMSLVDLCELARIQQSEGRLTGFEGLSIDPLVRICEILSTGPGVGGRRGQSPQNLITQLQAVIFDCDAGLLPELELVDSLVRYLVPFISEESDHGFDDEY